MKKLLFSLTFPILLSANPFEAELQKEFDYLQEETFVISASRVKEDVRKTASSVTIINHEMMENMAADNIMDVLATVPGIGITQSNIQAQEIEARGIKDRSSKQVLFMIDGHALDANLINGGSIWSLDRMNLDHIDRIEVIKGPASALYGTSAFTALVNIITLKPEDVDGTIVRLSTGSFNTKEGNILFGKTVNDFSILGNINFTSTDGNSIYVKDDRSHQNGYTNPYGDSFKANLKLKYKSFYLTALYSQRNDGPYWGAVGNLNDEDNHYNRQFFVEIGQSVNLNKEINIKTRLYVDMIRVETTWEQYSEGFPAPIFKDGVKSINGVTNEKDGVESLFTYKPTQNLTTVVGLMFEQQKQYDVTSSRNYYMVDGKLQPLESGMTDFTDTPGTFAPDISRNMWSGYMNNLYDVTPEVRLTLGIRYDGYNDFDSNIAPRGGISWQANSTNTFKFMYGEGYRIPTFAELYNTHVLTQGNPELTSENVNTQELTWIFQATKRFNIKTTLFNNNYTDLITKVITTSSSQYKNIGEVNTKGLEIEMKYTLNRGSYLKANYSYVHTEDLLTGDALPDVAQHKANFFFNKRLTGKINWFNHVFIKGETTRVADDSRDNVAGYALYNTAIKMKHIYKTLELKFSINNVFNKIVYDPSIYGFVNDDYETKSRSVLFNAQYKF